MRRRRFLTASAAVTIAGLAGCSGPEDDDDDGGGGYAIEDGERTETKGRKVARRGSEA